jgi:hypothetical protein
MKYNKEEAIKNAKDFIKEVKSLEEKYNMTFDSDTGDIYISYKTTEKGKFWDSISLDWDDSGLTVKEVKKKLKRNV